LDIQHTLSFDLEAILCDFDQLLSQHGEWVAHGLSDIFETARRQNDKMRDDLRHKETLIAGLEAKIRKIG
jgi:hypothetical protein